MASRKRLGRSASPPRSRDPARTDPPGFPLTVTPMALGGLGAVTVGTVVGFTLSKPGKPSESVHYVGTVLGAHSGPGDQQGGEWAEPRASARASHSPRLRPPPPPPVFAASREHGGLRVLCEQCGRCATKAAVASGGRGCLAPLLRSAAPSTAVHI
jgi:hypothetical protein